MEMPEKIGRFDIVKVLGKGSQGVVYLARDPLLERPVAIKTLEISVATQKDRHARLMNEARLAGRLRNPNIVSVYDMGIHEGKPYLVLEYVEGISLRTVIRKRGPMKTLQAISIMIGILNGIAYAHEKGVIHRDLKPTNILINRKRVPKIMDFGISTTIGARNDMAGTPFYMSPEHFSKAPLVPQSDIFSLGLVFYEMLVASPAFEAESHVTVMFKIANQPVEPPSLKNSEISEEINRIVLKAVEKSLELRYRSARDMMADLEAYLRREGDSGKADKARTQDASHSTVEFLLRRMSRKSDFPAFSRNVAEINEKTSSSAENPASALQLANIILKDVSLTNKLLRLVNSAFYGNLSGKITSITRAVMMLGFEQVRQAASSLMLFEHLQNKDQPDEMKDGAVSSFTSGLIARDLARDIRFKGVEEAFICSMIKNLGKHLVIYYLPEEYKEIKAAMTTNRLSDQDASRLILGISYDELATAVLRKWNYPEKIIEAVRRLPSGEVKAPESEVEALQCLSNLSNELCEAVVSAQGKEVGEVFAAISERYKKAVPVSEKRLFGLLKSARNKIEEYSGVLAVNVEKSEFLRRLGSAEPTEGKAPAPTGEKTLRSPSAPAAPMQRSKVESGGGGAKGAANDPASVSGHSDDELNVLINGIQEITAVLLSGYELHTIMFMVLETIFRGLNFNRVILCIRSKANATMDARFGFGDRVQEMIPHFCFDLAPNAMDLFNLAVFKSRDFLVEDSENPRISKHIPRWYREIADAPSFLIYPLMVQNVGLGLFYADRQTKGPLLTPEQSVSLETLRNQVIFAINQKADTSGTSTGI